MFIDLLFNLAIYTIISIIISLIFIFGYKAKIYGNSWVIYLISFLGCILGTLADTFFGKYFNALANLGGGKLNIYPPIFFAWIVVYIFIKAFNKKQ